MKNQNNTKTIGALAVALSAMLWGVDGILLTPQLYNLNTAFVVFVIHLCPFALMNVFFFREYRHLKTMTRSDLVYFLLIALFGGALGTLAMEDMESPFVVFGKNVQSGYLIEEPVVQYDIAATIAYILGLETPAAWRGKPVLSVFKP